MSEFEIMTHLERLATCQQAVSDLMCPDEDIADRDKISILLDYLAEQQKYALDALRQVRKAQQASS